MTTRYPLIALFAFALAFFSVDVAHGADTKTLRINLQQGRYAEVVEQIGQSPADAETVIVLARSLNAQGKRDEAHAAITTFTKDNQPTAALLAEAAQLHFQRGQWEQADQAVKRALALDESQTLARWLRAELARVQGDLEKAQQGYEWFIDFYNKNDQFDSAEDLYYVGLGASQ